MATDISFIDYVKGKLVNFAVRERKMFGEYMIYISDKPVLLVCDNCLFVKKFAQLDNFGLDTGVPYAGAKEHYVLDPEDGRLEEVV